MVIRTASKDRTLQSALADYRAYAGPVRYFFTEAVYRQELATLPALPQDDQVQRQTGLAYTDLADAPLDQGR